MNVRRLLRRSYYDQRQALVWSRVGTAALIVLALVTLVLAFEAVTRVP